MKPIPTLASAEINLPRDVAGLYPLAYNLWWTWTPLARRLFSMIDPMTWSRYANPVEILINFERDQWEALLLNDPFMQTYRRAHRLLEAYLEPGQPTWFERTHAGFADGPVAYFSPEFGLDASLGIYSGGLGVLSGDHCKAASDLGLPFIGIGLLYNRGYFRQLIDADGHQQHVYPHFDPARLPIRPAAGPTQHEVIVSVPFPGRDVKARVWVAQVGRVSVLLLDTDIPHNDPEDRPISHILYVRGRPMRLCQEVLLGVGGVRALRELGISPSCWHMNEGHSAFLLVERLREIVLQGGTIREATDDVRRRTVFTTHTPVAAGNEEFDASLAAQYIEALCADLPELKDLVSEVMRMALGPGQAERFNLTALSLRLSSRANAVSERHGEVARAIWRDILAEEGEHARLFAITNGIHTPTWAGEPIRELFQERVGTCWEDGLLDESRWQWFTSLDDDALWSIRQELKEQLLIHVRERVRRQMARHGRSPEELRDIRGLLDANNLTIGFARRFAIYKRADLIFTDLDRLIALLTDPDRPVQLIFAGKAHPADRNGQELVRRLFTLSRDPRLAPHLVFVEDYDMALARRLVQGCDVWLNNPRPPMEASGTSGMKAAANGVLNLSVLDGWWCEAYDETVGWQFGASRPGVDEQEQDRRDAADFYRILSKEVVPLYYDRDADGRPRGWLSKIRQTMARLTPRFSAARMVTRYVDEAYVPESRTD